MARTHKSVITEAMRLLGSRTSDKKAKSSAANGKKGGRPRKKPLVGVARAYYLRQFMAEHTPATGWLDDVELDTAFKKWLKARSATP